jgi:glycosyltransferase involved in cell wall biosynthesis
MVLYEAFANKIPVIVFDIDSLKEKVIDREDSYIFKT